MSAYPKNFFSCAPERRIYVAVLADYNAGRLTGRWIECDDLDYMQEQVAALLRSSKFPNVLVDCPDCEGRGALEGAPGSVLGIAPCHGCEGKGKVPSAEEYAIHDHEGFGRLIGEYTPLAAVAEWAEILDSVDDPDALMAFAEYESGDNGPEQIADDFRNAYLGQFDTLREWAEDYMEDTGGLNEVPEDLRGFIDMQQWGEQQERDWIFTIDAKPGIYVFRRDY